MAGITPEHTSVYALADLPRGHALVLAAEAVQKLGWRIQHFSSSGLLVISQPWLAHVIIRIDDTHFRVTSISGNNWLLDFGRNRKNVARLMDTIRALKEEILPEYLAWRCEELFPYLPPHEPDPMLERPKVKTQWEDMLSVFKPVKGYFFTPIIVSLNISVFLLMVLSGVSFSEPDSADLLAWGANYRLLVQAGEWWRLLTSCFIHIGVVHLLMNMYALFLVGPALEQRIGGARFLIAYLLTGIVASFTSIHWHDYTVSAGASGAIFGMYGVFFALLTTRVFNGSGKGQLFASIAFFIVYNLLNGLKAGIDNAAHVGGLLAGLVLGYLFFPALSRKREKFVRDEVLSGELELLDQNG